MRMTAKERKAEWVRFCVEDWYKTYATAPTNAQLAGRYYGIDGNAKKMKRGASWWSSHRPAHLNPTKKRYGTRTCLTGAAHLHPTKKRYPNNIVHSSIDDDVW